MSDRVGRHVSGGQEAHKGLYQSMVDGATAAQVFAGNTLCVNTTMVRVLKSEHYRAIVTRTSRPVRGPRQYELFQMDLVGKARSPRTQASVKGLPLFE